MQRANSRNAQLQWTGHTIRFPQHGLPRRIFFGELQQGHWKGRQAQKALKRQPAEGNLERERSNHLTEAREKHNYCTNPGPKHQQKHLSVPHEALVCPNTCLCFKTQEPTINQSNVHKSSLSKLLERERHGRVVSSYLHEVIMYPVSRFSHFSGDSTHWFAQIYCRLARYWKSNYWRDTHTWQISSAVLLKTLNIFSFFIPREGKKLMDIIK